MASSINAITTGSGGVVTTADNSGVLNLQSNGTTVATVGPTGFSTPSNQTINTANTFGFKNRIINGSLVFAQRGTSFSNVGSGSPPTYTLDRWCGWRGGYAANLDVSQQSGFGSFSNCLRMQRTSGTSSTAQMVMAQVIESSNMYDLAGQNITLSAYIRSGSNYSGGQVSLTVYFSTASNQTSSNLAGGSWTGSTSGGTSFTISSTATQYSTTVAVPSNALSMAIQIYWTPSGTASTNDYIEFSGVQLEIGSQATSFDVRSYGTELALCQRYYEQGGMSRRSGNRSAGTYETTPLFYKATKRTAPTVTISSGYTYDGWNQYAVGAHNNPSGSNDTTCWGNLECLTSGGASSGAVMACLWTSNAEL